MDENDLPKYEELEFEPPKIIKADDKAAGAATALSGRVCSSREAISAAELTQSIADFVEKLGHKPPVIMVETAYEIRAGFTEQVRCAEFKGRIYIVCTAFERGNTAAVVCTLWHELLHYELRCFLTEATRAI